MPEYLVRLRSGSTVHIQADSKEEAMRITRVRLARIARGSGQPMTAQKNFLQKSQPVDAERQV